MLKNSKPKNTGRHHRAGEALFLRPPRGPHAAWAADFPLRART